MTEAQRIRRNAVRVLERAYAYENEEALRYYERNSRYSWHGGLNWSLYGKAERILARIDRATKALKSIGLEPYTDCGAVCLRPTFERCNRSEQDYRMGVEVGTIEPY